jgi:hypothetical protein
MVVGHLRMSTKRFWSKMFAQVSKFLTIAIFGTDRIIVHLVGRPISGRLSYVKVLNWLAFRKFPKETRVRFGIGYREACVGIPSMLQF